MGGAGAAGAAVGFRGVVVEVDVNLPRSCSESVGETWGGSSSSWGHPKMDVLIVRENPIYGFGGTPMLGNHRIENMMKNGLRPWLTQLVWRHWRFRVSGHEVSLLYVIILNSHGSRSREANSFLSLTHGYR